MLKVFNHFWIVFLLSCQGVANAWFIQLAGAASVQFILTSPRKDSNEHVLDMD